jgi:hypothetical protein
MVALTAIVGEERVIKTISEAKPAVLEVIYNLLINSSV